MSEPMKKGEQTNLEDYSPKVPKMIHMMEEAVKKQELESYASDGEKPTKQSISYEEPGFSYASIPFINRFSAAYVTVENITGDGQEQTFRLFDTMSGCCSLRDRYDCKPSEAKKLIGDTEEQGGTEFTVDFLFGFAGYAYRKITDEACFKAEIITSICAKKPVIAQLKSGDRYRLITGYDGDDFIFSNGEIVEDKSQIELLYVFGEKIEPRYTLKHGLKNIEFVMECTDKEKMWEGYIEKMRCDNSENSLNKVSVEERKARMAQISKFADVVMICYFFSRPFLNLNYQELKKPALADMWPRLVEINEQLCSLAWGLIAFEKADVDWSMEHCVNGLGEMVTLMLEKMMRIDAETLCIVKRAIAIIE